MSLSDLSWEQVFRQSLAPVLKEEPLDGACVQILLAPTALLTTQVSSLTPSSASPIGKNPSSALRIILFPPCDHSWHCCIFPWFQQGPMLIISRHPLLFLILDPWIYDFNTYHCLIFTSKCPFRRWKSLSTLVIPQSFKFTSLITFDMFPLRLVHLPEFPSILNCFILHWLSKPGNSVILG